MRRPIPLEIPAHLVESAQLYAPSRHELDAVCYVLEQYPNCVADLRRLSSRVRQLDDEGAELDELLARLKAIAREIVDL
jgi:hypothetical protein